MTKINLNQDDLKKLTECINDQTEISQDLLIKLSPSFFDKLYQEGKFDFQKLTKYKIPTIEYAGKRPESVILAQAAIVGEAAPLQVVRNFGDSSDTTWRNMIVQGDNLQFLKTCYLNHDPLIKDKVKGKIKLIYIDPPFGTGDEYGGRNGEMSYSAKTMGAEFIEILRERLIYLRELLSDDGAIFIRLDYHFGHYIKVITDEIFGKTNFLNEIVINRTNKQWEGVKKFNTATDSLFIYSKTSNYNFETVYKKRGKDVKWINAHSPGIRYPRERVFNKKIYVPPDGRHWTFNQNTWTDIPGYTSTTNYPTENSEQVLERVIFSFSSNDDLVLDCFAGSGTTAAVAEKLGRRWIMCDFGKHAIYTMQKRIWNIALSKKLGQEAKKNEKYSQPPKPFSIISA